MDAEKKRSYKYLSHRGMLTLRAECFDILHCSWGREALPLTFCPYSSVAVISRLGILKLFVQILAASPLENFCVPSQK